MQIHKIIVTLDEKIFLEWCKTLWITDIKTNDDIIIGQKKQADIEHDEVILVIIHWKDPVKTTEYISSHYIHIQKLLLLNSAKILSNGELQDGDVIIPNTFIGKNDETVFLEETVGTDYDLNSFGLILNWIASCVEPTDDEQNSEEFLADVYSENIFTYLKLLQADDKIASISVMLQIWTTDYKNVIAVSDMSL